MAPVLSPILLQRLRPKRTTDKSYPSQYNLRAYQPSLSFCSDSTFCFIFVYRLPLLPMLNIPFSQLFSVALPFLSEHTSERTLLVCLPGCITYLDYTREPLITTETNIFLLPDAFFKLLHQPIRANICSVL